MSVLADHHLCVGFYWFEWVIWFFNSLAPRKLEWNFRYVIFKLILVIDGWVISCGIALLWMSLDFTDDQSTLVQVMVWCHQATSHHLSQSWPRSLPYRVGQSREIYSNSVPLSPPHWPYPKRIRPPSWPRVAVASSIQHTKLFTWHTWPGAGAVPKCDWAARSQCGGYKQWRTDHTKYIWYVATRGQSIITTELMIAWIW